MLKVELHTHTDDDPCDRIGHSTARLIDHAASLGYHALAVTLHDRYFDPAALAGYARDRGMTLLAGIERSLYGKHVLLINFPPEAADVRHFEDIAVLKRRCAGLVVAPHPFYPTFSALRGGLDSHADVIDAIEVNAMYTRHLDFNRRAVAWARARGKPLVGNSDLHLLEQMGTTYTLVDAERDPDAICAAIREGRVELRSSPLTLPRAVSIFGRMCWGGVLGRVEALVER